MDLLSPLGGKDYSIAERRGLQPRAFQSAERNNDDWWRYTVCVHGWCLVFVGVFVHDLCSCLVCGSVFVCGSWVYLYVAC